MITSSPFTRNTRARVASPTQYARHKLHRRAMSSLVAALACATGIALAAGFTETDLVANTIPLTDANGIVHTALHKDPNLLNPWGVGASSTSPFWVADNGAGVSTLYNTAGTPLALVVSIPAPDDTSGLGNGGTPTGLVFNITTTTATPVFKITGVDPSGNPKTAPAIFLFATEDGTILGWNPGVAPSSTGFTGPNGASAHAIIAVNHAASGAVYKGLAIDTVGGTPYLYATNFHAGTVEVFNGSFGAATTLPPGAFTDSGLPKGYAPFNIVPVGSRMFVTYAVQDADAHDDVAGQGHGIVDTFTLDGQMIARFAQHGQLDSPWGVAVAPASFGVFAGDILIGNFGNGHINVFDPSSGEFLDKLRNSHGQTIVIDGLWTLRVGSGTANGGDSTKVYFTAGPNDESDGLFGNLAPSP
jgi:uncharacterized protein (TIGR03118 family)